ncbi:hypothetical protein BRD15_00650 [Halobacteriales archaeon SW_6_65_15]|jgi:hypothetical protein|nr:MAG: hypothetical protein BRD15_00650 [Halobacteriales archaeon SW_6_65_15]
MVSSFTRRQYLFGAGGAVASGALLTNKVREILDEDRQNVPYRSRRNASFQTAEPVVTDTDISIDSPYPDSYAALVRTQEEADERYRVDYLQEEYDTDVSDLYTVDYETEFVAIVGYVLPRSRLLSLFEIEYEDGTLYTTHEITDSRTELDDLKVHHNLVIFRQEGHEPPEAIDADVCIK